MQRDVVLVTGGATGIGRAVSERVAATGLAVLVGQLGADGLEAPAGAEMVELDVRDEVAIEALLAQVAARGDRVVGLVNNAAIIGPLATLLEHPPDLYRAMLQTNLEAPFLVLRAVARHMAAGGSGGSIVNVSSVAGVAGEEFAAGYVAAKHGLVGLTRAAAIELAGHGIRVNAVAPGPVLTDAARAATFVGERREPLYPRVGKLVEYAEPSDVADAVAFLLGPGSRAITGVVLPVDGGYLL